MKKLLLLLLMVPAMALAEKGTTVQFPAYCFAYEDFLKQVDFFDEKPIIMGIRDDEKDKEPVLISVLFNKEDGNFSIVQFNKNVGCFLTVGKQMKFNMQGLKLDNKK